MTLCSPGGQWNTVAVTPPGGDHVLVVDDDDGIREMLQSTLTFAGFRVSAAPDAQTALTLFGTDDPDAIVLDVMMPGIDGFDFLQLLRHRGETLPVLFLSARDTVEDRVRGLRLGADDYLTKPFSVVEVTVRLEGLLRRSRLERDLAHAATSAGRRRCPPLRRSRGRRGPAPDPPRRTQQSTCPPPSSGCCSSCCCTRAGCCPRRRSSTSCGSTTSAATAMWSSGSSPTSGARSTSLAPPLIHTVRGFGYTIRSPEESE